jgi:mRNA interferase MazF
MAKQYTPARNEIIWLDFQPTKGKEICKYRPALVLSSQVYNKQSGLLICCPISTSIRGTATEVAVSNLEQPSVVATGLVQTLAFGDCKAKFIADADDGVMDGVLMRIIPLIGADQLIEKMVNK